MIDVSAAPDDREAWSSLVASSTTPNLLQTWEYGEAKAATSDWCPHRLHIRVDGELAACAQAMVRDLPLGARFAFVNRGPLLVGDPARTERAPAIMEAIRRHLDRERPTYLRIAPSIARGALPTPPAGFRASGMSAWTSSELDLRCDLETLRSNLQVRWRRALRKGELLGAVVELGSRDDLFGELSADYQEFLQRRRFRSSITPAILHVWRQRLSLDERFLVVVVRHRGRRVASGLFCRVGTQAEYLVGCFSDEGRAVRAGQLLMWNAVAHLKSRGAASFDVGGTRADQPGIATFKAGLGARAYELAEPLDARPSGLRWRALSVALRAYDHV